jgi:WD40 repeat protein/tRNA A-37 threonylcarbamoyl transferase component Bud32
MTDTEFAARAIFYRYLEKNPVDRTEFLEQACGQDAKLRREVEALLDVHDDPSLCLEEPAVRPLDLLEGIVEDRGKTDWMGPPGADTSRVSPVKGSDRAKARASPGVEGFTGRVGTYEVLDTLGRGGMGVVYKARHMELNRTVALKMTLANARPDELTRFRTEAEAVAGLDHPNVVKIFEVGSHAGLPYFALEYCPDGSLEQRLREGERSLRGSAEVVEQIARGVAAAHAQGIIHRDLKPANVLMDANGQPKVTDFGLAKKTDAAGMTAPGMLVGTPSYMAPEQAVGDRRVGPAADVWALGVILYQLLTGKLPFEAPSPLEVLHQAFQADPVPPRQIDRRVPRDLEVICLKCLSKEPGKRYVSADALADDLRRWLEGHPIKARPVSSVERGAKYMLRHPTVSALAAAVVLAVVSGAGFAGWFAVQARASAEEANHNALEAGRKAEEARTNAERARSARREADRARRAAENLASAKMLQAAWSELRLGNWLDAQRNLDEIPVSKRGWEFEYLRHRLNAEPTLAGHRDVVTNRIRCLAFSPNGRFLASGDEEVVVKLWSIESKRELFTLMPHGSSITGLAFNASSELLATGSNPGEITVWRTATGEKVLSFTIGPKHLGQDPILAFSGDDKMLASGDRYGSVKVWDATTGKLLQAWKAHAAPVRDLVFSPDSRRLASVDSEGVVKAWDLTTWRPEDVKVQASGGMPIHFGPKGELFCWRRKGDRLFLHNARTGRQPSSRPLPFPCWSHCDYASEQGWLALAGVSHLAVVRPGDERKPRVILTQGEVTAIALDPTGTWLAAADRNRIRLRQVRVNLEHQVARPGQAIDHQCHPALSEVISLRNDHREVVVWDPAGGKGERTLQGHQGKINHRAVSPDGQFLVTGSTDKTVRVWELSTGKVVAVLRGHLGSVRRVFPTGNPRYLASLDRQRLIVWDVVKGAPLGSFEGVSPLLASADPAGAQVAFVGPQDEKTKRYELSVFDCLSATLSRFPLPGGKPQSVHFGPLGKRIAVRRSNGVGVTDLSTGQHRSFNVERTRQLTFRPDGEQIAVVFRSSRVKVLNPITGQTVAEFGRVGPPIISQFFSPDGRRLVSVENDGRITIRETASYHTVLNLRVPNFGNQPLTGFRFGFARGGRDLVACCRSHVVIWGTGDEFPHHRFADFFWHLSGVALCPDLKHIATKTVTGPLTIWDVATRKPVQVIPDVLAGYYQGISFSPDGASAVIARKGRVEVRDVTRWKLEHTFPFGTDRPHQPRSVAFRPDGKCIAVGLENGTVSLWEIRSGKRLIEWKGNKGIPGKLIFSADGKRMAAFFATNTNTFGHFRDGFVIVWDVEKRRAVARVQLADHSIHDMDLSSDGSKLGLALGARGEAHGNGVVMIREVDTNKTLKRFEPHQGQVYGIDFSPDDKKLLTCGGDLAVRIWDANTLKELFVFYGHDNTVTGAVFGPHGNWVLTRGADFSCHLFKPTGRRGWAHPMCIPERTRRRFRR